MLAENAMLITSNCVSNIENSMNHNGNPLGEIWKLVPMRNTINEWAERAVIMALAKSKYTAQNKWLEERKRLVWRHRLQSSIAFERLYNSNDDTDFATFVFVPSFSHCVCI